MALPGDHPKRTDTPGVAARAGAVGGQHIANPVPSQTFAYDAVDSYRHMERDQAIADRLQAALHRFARSLWKLRAIRLYRDRTSIDARPDL